MFEVETEEDGIMARPPHPASRRLFFSPPVLWGLLQGLPVLTVNRPDLALAPGFGLNTNQVRSMTLAA